jgi:hypothetical protein
MRKEKVLSVFLAVLLCWGSALVLFSTSKETIKAAQRLQPSDLEYIGAFRLPGGVPGSDVRTWAWGGFAMTCYPDGDPTGPGDGYPGSIYGAGHAWEHQVSEISIPVPVISASKNLNDLNTASTLQSFQDIFDVSSLEIPRTGLAYLPKQDLQTTGKLYFCKGQHMHDETNFLTHGWCELNLSNPQVKGTWYLDCPHNIYNTNDLLFDIPTDWAAANTPGKLLATGRFRDGGWSGQGPSLFAIGPWNQGNPPPSGTSLSYETLLRYTSTEDPESWDEATNHTMTDYHHSDEWSGASWITAGNKAAVVFVGTKGTGDCWYGDSNGPCLDCQGERGWWSTGFEGQFIFYDPDDLAQVAAGTMESWEPQPYASLNVDQYLYHIESSQQWYHLGAACFDRTRGYLYVFEPYVDDDKPVIHVWKVTGGGNGSTETGVISLNRSRMNFGAIANGVSPDSQTFSIDNTGTGAMNWTVSDNAGWLTCAPTSGTDAGVVTVSADHSGLSAGSYSRTITVSSSDATNSPQTIAVTLNVYNSGASAPPFGLYSTPGNGVTVSSSVPFTGWVLDDIGVESVKIYRQANGSMVYTGDAVLVEGARPDVEQAYPDYPMNYKAGWGYMMLTNFLPGSGNGTFTIYAIATDKEGHQVTLGAKTITCDNANAVKPFGAIDTPAQGGTVSGSSFRNQGWVLTPLPNSIPTNGSTIHVFVDGVNLGNAAYNGYRSDIAALFPGYANSSGAAAYFDFDTTAYENGVHTIAWIAADNAGNSDGIGSRYFTIQNSAERIAHSAEQRAHSAERTAHSVVCLRPVGIIKGYVKGMEPQTVYPDDNGKISIKIKELERVVIQLNDGFKLKSGYLLKGSRLYSLPIGSTLDVARGIFYWQAGPAFVGAYDFVFIQTQDGKTIQKKIHINIVPKFKRNGEKNEK